MNRTLKNTFSQLEFEMMQSFLEESAQEFSHYGCNDFLLPATDENKALFMIVLQKHEQDDDNSLNAEGILEIPGKVFIYDDWLISYFADRCAALLTQSFEVGGLTRAELNAKVTVVSREFSGLVYP